jgi:hypothetical protein
MLRRLAGSVSLFLFFIACSPSTDDNGGGGGSGGSAGTTSGGGGTGSAGSGASGSGANTAGVTGAAGASNDGGTDGGASGSGPFKCPTVVATGNCAPPADIRCPAPKLSQTGCIDPSPFSDPKTPIKMASVVVPYDVNSPLWSDGALKTRGMRLPAGGKIHVKDCAKNPAECCVLDPNTLKDCLPPADDGKWTFPVGTVLVKNFMFPDASRPTGYKLVETRLFIHLDHKEQVQGVSTEWIGYGYQWDDAQTDATVVGTLVDGSDIGVSGTFQVTPTTGAATKSITWNYPSRLDCITCHMPIMPSGGYSLGPETIQMNRVATGDTMNQIDKLAALGLFETAPAKPYKAGLVPPYPGQSGSPPASATLEQRARSYLHANCAFCHRPDGKWNGFDVRYDIPLKSTAICNGVPGKGDLGVAGATLLTPKDAMSSLMWLRMKAPAGNATTGGTGRMPAIASDVVDTQATELISQWISSINACPM